MKIYVHKQDIWSEAECRKRSRYNPPNAYGDKNPWPGLISGSADPYAGYGHTVRYNGGCIRDGEWYDGESKPLPKIPETYRFVYRPTWGTYLERVK